MNLHLARVAFRGLPWHIWSFDTVSNMMKNWGEVVKLETYINEIDELKELRAVVLTDSDKPIKGESFSASRLSKGRNETSKQSAQSSKAAALSPKDMPDPHAGRCNLFLGNSKNFKNIVSTSDGSGFGSNNSLLQKDLHLPYDPCIWDEANRTLKVKFGGLVGPGADLDPTSQPGTNAQHKKDEESGPSKPPGFDFQAQKNPKVVKNGKTINHQVIAVGSSSLDKNRSNSLANKGKTSRKKKYLRSSTSLSSLFINNRLRRSRKRRWRRRSAAKEDESITQTFVPDSVTPIFGINHSASKSTTHGGILQGCEKENNLNGDNDLSCELKARET
ncbi:hypothetical protein REPUB_Repub11eG0119100 [Reevesia pubescens]